MVKQNKIPETKREGGETKITTGGGGYMKTHPRDSSLSISNPTKGYHGKMTGGDNKELRGHVTKRSEATKLEQATIHAQL